MKTQKAACTAFIWSHGIHGKHRVLLAHTESTEIHRNAIILTRIARKIRKIFAHTESTEIHRKYLKLTRKAWKTQKGM